MEPGGAVFSAVLCRVQGVALPGVHGRGDEGRAGASTELAREREWSHGLRSYGQLPPGVWVWLLTEDLPKPWGGGGQS